MILVFVAIALQVRIAAHLFILFYSFLLICVNTIKRYCFIRAISRSFYLVVQRVFRVEFERLKVMHLNNKLFRPYVLLSVRFCLAVARTMEGKDS